MVAVCRLEEIEEGKGRLFEVDGECVAVFRHCGRLFALDNDCPHRGGALAFGEVRSGTVHCPLHAWPFDLVSGACREVPGARVRPWRVAVRGGKVHVGL